jgi:diguanylate cyclase (GGDEF)-like protein
MTPTPERRLVYFMSSPIAQRTLGVFTYGDSVKIQTENDLNNLRIGFREGSIIAQSIMNFYPNLNFETLMFTSGVSEVELLRNGIIDAYISDTVVASRYKNDEHIVFHEVLPLVYGPVSLSTANPEFAPVISVVNKYIAAGGIYRLYELYRAGNFEYTRYLLNRSFTVEERAYLDSLSAKVPVALEFDNYPVSFFDKTAGEFQGIAVDVLAEISRLTGVEFEIVNDKNTTWASMLEMLRTGEVALVSELLVTEGRREHFIWPQTPYFSSPYAFISKSDYPYLELYQIAQAITGTVRGTSYEEMYRLWFPDSTNLRLFDTHDEVLDALEKGEINLVLASAYLILYQINYRERFGYKINYAFPFSTSSYFGFNKDETILCGIVCKAMSFIDTYRISRDWTSRVYDYSRKLAEERAFYMSVFVAILSLILVFLTILLRKNIQKRNTIIKQSSLLKEADAYAKLMLDSTPLCCQLWSSDFEIIDCNEAAVKLYGLKSKQEYIERFFECSPERQSDGELSSEKAITFVKKAFAEGRCVFEWMHQTPDDSKHFPAEITLVRIKHKGSYVVAGYTRDLRDISSMERQIFWLKAEAEKIYYDALTGIYNRRYFDENLSRLIKSMSRSGDVLSLMMVDIDHFKNYNDTYGHSEGDECLKIIAKTLSKSVARANDFVARYGGEEFAVVLPNTDENGARVIANRLLENIRNCRIPHEKSDVSDHVTVSIGVTTGRTKHTREKDDYIKRADEMLYMSKRNGRNRYTFEEL